MSSIYSCGKYKTQELGDEIHGKPLDTPIKVISFYLGNVLFWILFFLNLNVVLDIGSLLDKNKIL